MGIPMLLISFFGVIITLMLALNTKHLAHEESEAVTAQRARARSRRLMLIAMSVPLALGAVAYFFNSQCVAGYYALADKTSLLQTRASTDFNITHDYMGSMIEQEKLRLESMRSGSNS